MNLKYLDSGSLVERSVTPLAMNKNHLLKKKDIPCCQLELRFFSFTYSSGGGEAEVGIHVCLNII